MTTKTYEKIGETCVETKLENGLRICVFPKPEFGKCFAFFATQYGGMDTRFQQEGVWQDTPMGVAHFLEHKMFDTKDGNALQILSANGASPNAFTSSAITGYYFESTEKFEENLDTLLNFVSIPYFIKESVEKEQGIIGQEIRMIEDNPNWQVFMKLLGALYEYHPIRNSVAGSQESISHITAETLYDCHKAFYHPANMALCVAGNVDPQGVCDLARRILPAEGRGEVPRDYGGAESRTVFQTDVEVKMEVATPIFQLGIKLTPAKRGAEAFRQKLLGELVCEALLGSSSPLYAKLYTEGLIHSDFYYGYEAYPGCAFLIAGGESNHPVAVREAVWNEAERIAREGLDEALFRRLKKAAYGNQVRALGSFETLCVERAQGYFRGEDMFSFPEVYETLGKTDVEKAIQSWIHQDTTAMAVVRPLEAGA